MICVNDKIFQTGKALPGILRWLLLAVLFALPCRGEAALSGPARPPAITAEAAIVVEASTGRVLYEKNADRLMYPASMTKIMTCLLALEKGDLNTPVTVSEAAADTEYAELSAGDRLTMEELLTEMMLESDNGASVAVAEQLAPSVDQFSELMTERAAALGADRTQFRNPNGLPALGHVSTARDMMKISRAAWELPIFRRIVGTARHTVRFQSPQSPPWEAENTNHLLGQYRGMVGIKTGWTEAAGGCLAGAAERNGVTLISIVMNAINGDARFSDTAALLDYGFSRVRVAPGPPREKIEGTVWVHNGSTYKVTAHPRADVRHVLLDGETERRCSLRLDMPRFINAPIRRGDKVGELVLCYEGKETGRIDMIADSSMEIGFSPMAYVIDFYDRLLGPLLG